jgi:diguanylate cyclase (GGDEF)-like protein
MRRHIQRMGHECVEVNSGEEAWQAFESTPFDVIISDWLMPGIEGPELCRRLRAVPGRPYTYFILLTALDGKGHFLSAMDAGVDDVLVKPLEKDVLMARLTAAERVTGVHRQLEKKTSELQAANRELHQIARIDPLTKVGNRLRLDEDLSHVLAEVDRYHRPFFLGMVDVDHFKLYNDHYGHVAGDHALVFVASVLVNESRAGDRVYRYGGEEFVVLLPGSNLDGAAMALERFRCRVENERIPHDKSAFGVLTISGGVAPVVAAGEHGSDETIGAADRALYEAKSGGRNRIGRRG